VSPRLNIRINIFQNFKEIHFIYEVSSRLYRIINNFLDLTQFFLSTTVNKYLNFKEM